MSPVGLSTAFLASLLLFGHVANAAPQSDYKIDNLRLDQILNNKRLMDSYLKCYLDKGPCTSETRDAKKSLADVIATNCGKCTANEKKLVKKAMNKLNEIRPQGFQDLLAKYDPPNKHRADFVKWLKTS